MTETTMTMELAFTELQRRARSTKDLRAGAGGGAKYNYRSLDTIIEDTKRDYTDLGFSLRFNDYVEFIGERYFLRSVAIFTHAPTQESISGQAWVELIEPDTKGMSLPQKLGSASSYARKYALSGLLALDDNDDPDSDEFRRATQQDEPTTTPTRKSSTKTASSSGTGITEPQIKLITNLLEKKSIALGAVEAAGGVEDVANLGKKQASDVIEALKALPDAKKERARAEF